MTNINRVMLTEHAELCVIAESILAALPDDASVSAVQTIMNTLSPDTILAKLHASGYKIVRAD